MFPCERLPCGGSRTSGSGIVSSLVHDGSGSLVLDGLGFPFGMPRPSAFRTDPFGSTLLPISVFLGIRTVVIVLSGTIPIPVVERTRNEQK